MPKRHELRVFDFASLKLSTSQLPGLSAQSDTSKFWFGPIFNSVSLGDPKTMAQFLTVKLEQDQGTPVLELRYILGQDTFFRERVFVRFEEFTIGAVQPYFICNKTQKKAKTLYRLKEGTFGSRSSLGISYASAFGKFVDYTGPGLTPMLSLAEVPKELEFQLDQLQVTLMPHMAPIVKGIFKLDEIPSPLNSSLHKLLEDLTDGI